MTKNFKESSWGRFEFRMAIQATSIDRYKRLIIIVYPEVEDFNDLDSELKTYMKLNTYLRRDDPQFWRKLIYAMPHNHGSTGRTDQQ
ncbi:protein toll-like [Drosophila montana]|uniref:protein toll-like n=1 Tax=Drosophila montana TaxID=40370 RepID=UPI00313D3B88